CHMNGTGDEDRVDSGVSGSLDIGAHAVTNRKYTLTRNGPTLQLGKPFEGQVVNGAVGLPSISHLATEPLVLGSERTSAVDDAGAALNLQIGIGADHRHAPPC